MAKQAKKAAGKAKKKTPIWYSVTILAVIVIGIIGAGVSIYWEQLFPESHRKMTQAVGEAATRAKSAAKSEFKDLMTKAGQFNFNAKGTPLCQEAELQSSTPKGWEYRELASVLGLPHHPSREAILERCREYADAIGKMQDLSGPKAIYEVICVDRKTHFEIDPRRGYAIYPEDTGVLQKVTSLLPRHLPVRTGEIRLIQSWQVYGLGGGCYVIGSDKLSTFKRSGEVKEDSGGH